MTEPICSARGRGRQVVTVQPSNTHTHQSRWSNSTASTSRKIDKYLGITPALLTRPWLASGWGCRGRRLSKGRSPYKRAFGKEATKDHVFPSNWYPDTTSDGRHQVAKAATGASAS